MIVSCIHRPIISSLCFCSSSNNIIEIKYKIYILSETETIKNSFVTDVCSFQNTANYSGQTKTLRDLKWDVLCHTYFFPCITCHPHTFQRAILSEGNAQIERNVRNNNTKFMYQTQTIDVEFLPS